MDFNEHLGAPTQKNILKEIPKWFQRVFFLVIKKLEEADPKCHSIKQTEIYIHRFGLYTILPNIRRAQYNIAFPYKHATSKTNNKKSQNPKQRNQPKPPQEAKRKTPNKPQLFFELVPAFFMSTLNRNTFNMRFLNYA